MVPFRRPTNRTAEPMPSIKRLDAKAPRRNALREYMLSTMNTGKSNGELDGEKGSAARAVLRFVQSGMIVGLGSGSTAAHFITVLGDRLRRDGLRIEAVPSSLKIAAQAKQVGVPLVEPRRGLRLDLTVDGADEIAPDLGLIKGAGGALMREKVLARASRHFLVIADSSKLVSRLGARAMRML